LFMKNKCHRFQMLKAQPDRRHTLDRWHHTRRHRIRSRGLKI
jgi:hypothetical protein